jgi:hypothetical protein
MERRTEGEVLAVVQYDDVVRDGEGGEFVARVYCGRQPGGLWEGWFVFFPLGGGRALPTDRETTQSSPAQIEYWSGGITHAYLEGALERAKRNTPSAKRARRRQHLERAEAAAVGEAAVYERAAARALAQAADITRARGRPRGAIAPSEGTASEYEREAEQAKRLAGKAERRRVTIESVDDLPQTY